MAKPSLYHLLCQETTLYNAWKTVKAKNSVGGIDGISVIQFEDKINAYLTEITTELKAGKWQPEPYLRIEIPKKENEKRQLGLLSVKDKIVQQAIKNLIEPRCENLFLNNSYGYRPQKGHAKAIRRCLHECRIKKNNFFLRLDIDNYFDSINHDLLTARLHATIPDQEIVRLIMLCVKMGVVTKNLSWQDTHVGLPQGAVLSPLLANLYLHSFDQFMTEHTQSYIRYADDFLIFCETAEQTQKILTAIIKYLASRLNLKLNEPIISEIKEYTEIYSLLHFYK